MGIQIDLRFTIRCSCNWDIGVVFHARVSFLVCCAQSFLTSSRSPWWLLSRGREAGASKSLKQLGYSPDNVERRMAAMVLTLEEVRRETEGASFLECFKKSNLRRTMISIAPLSIQALSGICRSPSTMTFYAAYSIRLCERL